MSNEREAAAYSYIVNFYREVEALTHSFANYMNLSLEIEKKYPDQSKMEQPVKDVALVQSQEVRMGIIKTYIRYQGLSQAAKIENSKKIDELYVRIKAKIVPDREDLENYVVEINSVLINDVIQNLLATGQDLFKSVYTEQTPQ